MNKKILLLVSLLLLIFNSPLFAQAPTTINLKDGSSIKGTVLRLENHIYTIQTTNLGEIKVNDSDVLNISMESPQSLPQPNPASIQNPSALTPSLPGQAQALQANLLNDQDIMADIQKLLQDPQIVAIFSDPQLMNDILSNDPQKIQNNTKIQSLMENPQMKEILLKASQKFSPAK